MSSTKLHGSMKVAIKAIQSLIIQDTTLSDKESESPCISDHSPVHNASFQKNTSSILLTTTWKAWKFTKVNYEIVGELQV